MRKLESRYGYTLSQIWEAAQKIYADYPELLKAAAQTLGLGDRFFAAPDTGDFDTKESALLHESNTLFLGIRNF